MRGEQRSIQVAAKENAHPARLKLIKLVSLEESMVAVAVAMLNETNNTMFKVLKEVNDKNVKENKYQETLKELFANL